MQNRLSDRLDRLSWRSGAAALLATLGVAVCLVSADTARSQSADCQRLRQEISELPRNSQSAQYQAAAEKQRAEIDRTVAYAHSIGCEKRQFLFFGSPPPAECGPLDARMARMRANLDDLQARAGGGQGGRGELIARYNAQYTNAPSRSPNLLEALFGQPKPAEVRDEPLLPEGLDKPERTIDPNIGELRAGSKAVCVRACDGAFFPVSYSASGGRLDGLEDLCRALCPNADVSLYTYPSSGEIEQAVSISGTRYIDSPNALQYRKTFDSSCSCRRRGQSWAEALANAEIKLGREDKTDIIVTPEKAAELSRPKPDPKVEAKSDPKAKSTKPIAASTPVPAPAAPSGTDAYGVDSESEPAGRHRQSRDVGHRGRRGQVGPPSRSGPGSDHRSNGPGRRQAAGADNRADALARPISGSAASSGPDFALLSAPSARDERAPGPCARSRA